MNTHSMAGNSTRQRTCQDEQSLKQVSVCAHTCVLVIQFPPILKGTAPALAVLATCSRRKRLPDSARPPGSLAYGRQTVVLVFNNNRKIHGKTYRKGPQWPRWARPSLSSMSFSLKTAAFSSWSTFVLISQWGQG